MHALQLDNVSWQLSLPALQKCRLWTSAGTSWGVCLYSLHKKASLCLHTTLRAGSNHHLLFLFHLLRVQKLAWLLLSSFKLDRGPTPLGSQTPLQGGKLQTLSWQKHNSGFSISRAVHFKWVLLQHYLWWHWVSILVPCWLSRWGMKCHLPEWHVQDARRCPSGTAGRAGDLDPKLTLARISRDLRNLVCAGLNFFTYETRFTNPIYHTGRGPLWEHPEFTLEVACRDQRARQKRGAWAPSEPSQIFFLVMKCYRHLFMLS